MSDDRNKDQSGGGFDDWLDDEPGPPTDPYEALATQDSEEDLAEWREFTEQESGVGSQALGAESEDGETAEIDVVVVDEPEVDDAGSAVDTAETGTVVTTEPEADVDDSEAETAEIDAVIVEDESDEDHDDTGELEVIADERQTTDSDEDDTDELEVLDTDDETTPDEDDLAPVASIGFGELWGSETDEEGTSSVGTSPDLFDISQDDYLQTATKEHAGLAESIAQADDEITEQVALAASLPGLDATVVGFEDVVEAEGHGKVRAQGSSDLMARVITAAVLVAALAASLVWRPALVAFALFVFVLGAGEFYTALARSGRKPIALFGFIGIIAASLGAFFFSALWIPLGFILATTLLLLFYAVVPGKVDPMANVALTVTVMVWAGLGSFALLIVRSDAYRTLVFGVVVAVAAMDIAQYFFGRALGRHQLAPWVSPKKTIEGLVAGVVVALTVGALLHFFKPFELTSGLAIGAAVAVFAPIGDLAMSAAKRSLGLKDMGSVLPGHGGFMDRVDGLLFVIPVAWAIFLWAGIL